MPEPLAIENWSAYYALTASHPPHTTLITTLKLIKENQASVIELLAVDLGCGSGPDTLELLRRGWSVIAIDQSVEALNWIRESTSPSEQARLTLQEASFERVELPQCYLLNASFSIPFCSEAVFNQLWLKITKAIQVGGYFAGHFFGPKDDYAGQAQVNTHSRADIEEIFACFRLKMLDERDERGPMIGGGHKHWHVFSVVAQKK